MIGEEGVEQLLIATIEAAVSSNAVKPAEFEKVIIDSTVMEKAIAHPTDSRLLEIARYQVVKTAKAAGVMLKQTYAKEAQQLRRKAGGYAHARQFNRLRKVVNARGRFLALCCARSSASCLKVTQSLLPFNVWRWSCNVPNDSVRRSPKTRTNSMHSMHLRSPVSAKARHGSPMSLA
jgi:IS5 family transposase